MALKLQLPRSMRVHPNFHVSKIKPVHKNPLLPPCPPPPPQVMIEGGHVYAVRHLLRPRKRGRGLQYLVDWEGYGPQEPHCHIVDPQLIWNFHLRHSEQSTLRRPRRVIPTEPPTQGSIEAPGLNRELLGSQEF